MRGRDRTKCERWRRNPGTLREGDSWKPWRRPSNRAPQPTKAWFCAGLRKAAPIEEGSHGRTGICEQRVQRYPALAPGTRQRTIGGSHGTDRDIAAVPAELAPPRLSPPLPESSQGCCLHSPVTGIRMPVPRYTRGYTWKRKSRTAGGRGVRITLAAPAFRPTIGSVGTFSTRGRLIVAGRAFHSLSAGPVPPPGVSPEALRAGKTRKRD